MGNCFSVQVGCDSLTGRCWDCVAAEVKLVSQLELRMTDLRTAKDELVAQQEYVMRRISLEETAEMERLPQVDNWLRRVEGLEAEVDQLLQTASQQSSKLCLGGCYSMSCMSSYKFGKEVAKKLNEVGVEKCKVFDRVVAKAPARPVVKRNVGPTVGMEAMLDRAWSLLMDNQVNTLGIWGMGGVGKTTLLKQINNKFLNVPHDSIVIYVVVSSKFTVEKVQHDVWKSLGFPVDEGWKSKRCQEKANDIFYVLNKKKFVLLLDDVWEQINLEDDIGVPKERNGSKIVFTTRDEDICGQMDADKQIKVEALPWSEAWELFQQKVGEDALNSHPDIPSLAQVVAKECAGLPIALITIARSMARKKTPREWNNAIETLKLSASRFRGMDKVLGLLKFSYESLSDDTTRYCFLYCCLFPEDYKIAKSDLVDYWVGEGFCTTPINGYEHIGTLVRACLLQEEGEHVKLHDVIRDMALWIACECQDENERFLVETGRGLTEIQEIENWRAKKRISMMDNKIEHVVGAPICPNLHTLFLRHNKCLMNETAEFFQSMDALRVLDLSWNFNNFCYWTQFLDCSALVSLQYLNLSHTDISRLPSELKMLVNLKCLSLEYTFYLLTIPRELISSLSRLQVLRMYKCRYMDRGGNSLKEARCLQHLNILTTTIRHASILETFSSDPKLVRCTHALSLETLIGSESLNISSFADMVQLEELHIVSIRMAELSVDSCGIQRILVNRSFNNLRKVEVVACQYLLDFTWLVLVPNLSFLSLSDCKSIEEIINPNKFVEISSVHQQAHPFAKLEVLGLSDLPQLKRINYSPLPVPYLQQIYVNMCPRLKKLPLDSNSARGCNLVIKGKDDWWGQLEWDDVRTKTKFLSCFVSV